MHHESITYLPLTTFHDSVVKTHMKEIVTKYKHAVVACDIAVFTVSDDKLKVLLMKMKKYPYSKHWALPGGLIKTTESVNQAAARLLLEKTGLRNVFLEQLYTFGEIHRDPFGRVVSVAYFALIPGDRPKLQIGKEHNVLGWFLVDKLSPLAYDHKAIVEMALNRLKTKLAYTNIVYSLLPEEFTLGQLQKFYEIILGKKIDKRNFRKKFLSLGLIRSVRKNTTGFAHRPALLYTFKNRTPTDINIL